MKPGDRVHVRTPGIGDYVNLFALPPEAVRLDVELERHTPKQPQELFGVVLLGSPPVMEVAATGKARASRPKPLDKPPEIG
jgi:N-methylhydantoinase B